MKENISLHKGFAIIECLARHGELSIQRLTEELDMNKTTVYRFLSTLSTLGYVQQDPDSKHYSLTYKLFQIGREKSRNQTLTSQVRPFMEKLLKETGESVHLAVLQGAKALYIDQVESRNTIRVNVEIGKTFPAYSVGVGKAILAYMPENEVIDLYREETFVRFTEKTIDSLDKLMEELKVVRDRGYSFDNEECMIGLACIAVPLISFDKPVAAMSVTFPRFRYAEGSQDEQKLIDQVVSYGRMLNTLLS
ncbi:MAG: IclR family transcriptional regulator [Synergistales bacterium]|nr:IclR family transcriptional regulator [Synergistales bacterium]